MTDTLQATVEFSVDLCRLHNVDLFQRGRYQLCAQLSLAANYIHTVEVVCCDERVQAYASSSPNAGPMGKSETNGRVCGRLALSRIVPILYRNEDIPLNNMFRFRCDIALPVDGAVSASNAKNSKETHDTSSVASLLEAAQFRLEVGLLFAEMVTGGDTCYRHGNQNQTQCHKLSRAASSNGSCETTRCSSTSPPRFSSAGNTAAPASGLQLVSVRTLNLHFSPHCGLHYHLPVLFDYHHLAAVSVTIHSSLVAIQWRPSPELLAMATVKVSSPADAGGVSEGTSQVEDPAGSSGPIYGSKKSSAVSKTTVMCSVRRLRRLNGCTKAASTLSYAYGDTLGGDDSDCDICDARSGGNNGTATAATSECRDKAAAKLRHERLVRQRHVDACSILLACIDSLHTHIHMLSVQLRHPHSACGCHTQNTGNSNISASYWCCHKLADTRSPHSTHSHQHRPCSDQYRRRLRELCVALSAVPAHAAAERDRLAASHVQQLSRLATGSWHTLLALATGSAARRNHVRTRLARRHHALRVRRFSEAFFVSTVPRTVSVATGCYGDDSAARQAQATTALRANTYLRHLPPLPVECVPLDGLPRSMPVVYEERYCPVGEFFAGGDKLNNRSSLVCGDIGANNEVTCSKTTTKEVVSGVVRSGGRLLKSGKHRRRAKTKRNSHTELMPVGSETLCRHDIDRKPSHPIPSVHYSSAVVLSSKSGPGPEKKLLNQSREVAKHPDSMSLCEQDVYDGDSKECYYQLQQLGGYRLHHTLSLLSLPRNNGVLLPRRRLLRDDSGCTSDDHSVRGYHYQHHNVSSVVDQATQLRHNGEVYTTSVNGSCSSRSTSESTGGIDDNCLSSNDQLSTAAAAVAAGGGRQLLARDNYSSSLPDLHSSSSSSSTTTSTNGCVSFSGGPSGPGESSLSSMSLCAPLSGARAARLEHRAAIEAPVARSVSAGVCDVGSGMRRRDLGPGDSCHGSATLDCRVTENAAYMTPWCHHNSLGGATGHSALFDSDSVTRVGEETAASLEDSYELSCDCYSAALCGQGDPTLQQRHHSALGRTTARFVAAKQAFLTEWSPYLTARVYADCIRSPVDMWLPYFSSPVSQPWLFDRGSACGERGVHLVVCVHGLDGTCADLRLVRAYLQLAMGGVGGVSPRGCPGSASARARLVFLMSSANQGDTFSDLQTLSDRLVEEIGRYVEDELDGVLPVRLSFIGHSLGCVIAHSALSHHQMSSYLGRLHTFLSLSGPHLGLLYNSSGLVQAGLWLMQRLKQSTALRQLAMRDAADIRQTFLYRLARTSQLYRFRHVLLVGSSQDKYVPLHSARIELCRAAVRDRTPSGATYREMVQLIVGPMVERSNASLVRYNVHHALGRSTSALIGRAAHVASLDSELFIEKFILVSALKYFK